MTNNKVGVVIPFYQTDKGILIKAINSICAQDVENVFFSIVIIDDESPISAESEISSIQLPDNCVIELIKQKNGGPAHARNTGLDYLQTNEIPIVAFLDSDDIWAVSHIAVALAAIAEGASFYFCDHKRFNSTSSWFAHLDTFKNWGKLRQDFNISTDLKSGLLSLKGADCFRLFLQDYISQTSSVVYNFSEHAQERFNPQLVSAGEDFFLWLQLVSKSKKVSFSRETNLYCGEGVNIYFASFDWSKLASSSQQGCHFLLYLMIDVSFELAKEQVSYIKSQQSLFVWRYSYLMVKHLLLGKGFNKKLFKSILQLSPFTILSLPVRFVIAVFNKKKLQLDKKG